MFLKNQRALLPVLAIAVLTIGIQPRSSAQTLASDPTYQTLTANNVYVDPALKGIDQSQLQQAAMQATDSPTGPHTQVKIAVLAHLPDTFTDRNVYAHILGQELNLGNNAIIVVVMDEPQRGASIVAPNNILSDQDKVSLVQSVIPEIRNDPTYGIADLATKTASAIDGHEYGSSTVLWVVFLVVVIAITVLLISGTRRKKSDLAGMRASVQAIRNKVLADIEYLDGYVDVLPKNNPDSDQVRIFTQEASTKFDQAAKIIDRASEASDLNRAQGLLDRAQADAQQARRYLDRATGGKGEIPEDTLRPRPLPDTQTAVGSIPANQRGVSFFSSRPAPVGSLVPVTVTINGEGKQVLVTPDEADELRQGRMPQMRSFQVNGQSVPWYAYQGYDPYRDYWRYENSGWGGFGGGVVAGLVGAELMDSLFAPQFYSPGYMPYAFATDNAYYSGYQDAMVQQDYGLGGVGADFGNAAGGDFGGFNNNNDGVGQYDDSAGVNFGDNSGSWGDTGDSGSSWGDAGGSDFGGGDFGGGGDSGGSNF